ncbi:MULTISPECIES: hypothetical protein [unclassified Synechococcus]|uniref:hypothetical protein n=1 Tax=unclassified Synechococcus TaxID=2626047 RepID=UPI0006527B6C|nr:MULTISPECIES: hypothetical protein [unclassified Synechococcus]AKN62121.1 DNA polymerase [Synechococcus sp. WH 8020]
MTHAERIKTRSVLLEFLKFRVLAAGQQFFDGTGIEQRRQWLASVHPQALSLSDDDLEQIWNQARTLYMEC